MNLDRVNLLKWKLLMKDCLGLGKFQVQKNSVHLKEAAEWIIRAQDATPDRGVSIKFNLSKGWGASYPETTGYIIPTLLDYARFSGNDEYKYRALEMADWELSVQLDCGAIQAGTVDVSSRIPTIFNTGQVLFGWISAFKETGKERYLKAATKAVNWLVDVQEPDGFWKKHASPFATYKMNTYNVRTAWGIYLVYEITQDSKYLQAALKNVRWAIKQQNSLGWFDNNCLSDNSRPLTHTIGYTIEGILGIGIALGDQEFIDAAQKTARALMSSQTTGGSLAGRFDAQWRPSVRWSCLTGIAQIAICWWQLYKITKDKQYREAALKANQYLKSIQNISIPHPGIRGGIKGSHPINGKYCSYGYPNWAAKFFMDSLLLEEDAHLSSY